MSNESIYSVLDLTQVIFEDRYLVKQKLGDGSFGTVYLAQRKEKNGLYETALRKISKHPCLIDLLETFMDPYRNIFLVMEFMDCNLFQLFKRRQGRLFTKETAFNILLQIISGIEHIHKHGFMHRDIKPENILVKRISPKPISSRYSIKLGDFGLARPSVSSDPLTEYVSTRWYRAPELLLRSGSYNHSVDLYAFGCIVFEIYSLKPLFPGRNETDQLNRVCEILGNPGIDELDTLHYWSQAKELAKRLGFMLPPTKPYPIQKLLPQNCPEGHAKMIPCLLAWNPDVRPTAKYCKEVFFPLPPSASKSNSVPQKISNPKVEQNLGFPISREDKKSTRRVGWLKKNLSEFVSSVKSVFPDSHGSQPHVKTEKPINAKESTGHLANPIASSNVPAISLKPGELHESVFFSENEQIDYLLTSIDYLPSYKPPSNGSNIAINAFNETVGDRIPSSKDILITEKIPFKKENEIRDSIVPSCSQPDESNKEGVASCLLLQKSGMEMTSVLEYSTPNPAEVQNICNDHAKFETSKSLHLSSP
nr:MEIOSIS INDUCTION PROTEIN KINASE SME1/IME2 [Schizosaccharomyces pombe]